LQSDIITTFGLENARKTSFFSKKKHNIKTKTLKIENAYLSYRFKDVLYSKYSYFFVFLSSNFEGKVFKLPAIAPSCHRCSKSKRQKWCFHDGAQINDLDW
jgi:hypothetical protein